MHIKFVFLSSAVLCLSSAAVAQSTQQCPVGATNCTISVQDAGHNATSASADNTTTTSSIAGTSSASNQSGNSVAPVFDNSAQTTQNATTTTGSVNSASTSTGNTATNANQSSATNGNQSLGQSNTGSSWNSVGGSSSGANMLTNGSASTSAVGATTSSSGGNTLGSKASNSGGNSTTTVDASDRSVYRSKAIFIPPVIPGTPASQLAIGNIIKETSACGPLQRIVRQPVTGTFIGLLRNSAVAQGWSDDLEPYRDANDVAMDYRLVQLANGDVRTFGHQVVMFTTVIGIASNRNLALGGGGSGGSWGQAGMGSSSSNQRMVTTIQLRDCEIGTMHAVLVEVPPKSIRH